MNNRQLSGFQMFSLGAMASALGLFVYVPGGFSPGYFWAVIAVFLLQSLSLAFLCHACARKSDSCGVGIGGRLFSSPPGRLLMGFFGLLLLTRSALTLSFQTDCIALYLLEDTPNIAVMAVLLATSFFTLLPGLRRLSGVSTLLTLILTGLIGLIVISGLIGSDLRELRTLAQPAAGEFLPALIPAAITASGAECAFFFLHPSPGRKERLSTAAAPAVCAAVFALLVCAAIGTIGAEGMRIERFPLVEGARQINLGGIELTERFDLPLLTVSLLGSLVQMAIYTLCAAHALSTALNSRRTGTVALLLLPAQLLAALVIQYTALDGIITALCAAGLTGFSLVILPLTGVLRLSPRKEVCKA